MSENRTHEPDIFYNYLFLRKKIKMSDYHTCPEIQTGPIHRFQKA